MLGMPTRRIRIIVQFLIFGLWVALILATRHPMDSWIARHIPVSLMLRIDPLVATVVTGGMRMMVSIVMLGFVTLIVSVLLGRVFCGWVCPLGSIFDFYGWFLRRFRVKFHGPSPKWYRLKYYLFFATVLFALVGGVSPLMGLDPIVLLTRTAATVINPFLNLQPGVGLLWDVDDGVLDYGYFVDGATLFLFILIMAGTTKVSRIWCRTACPLGAYLGLLGRNAILRRDTKGCVHCNICSNHCPTGAINFDNAEIYNESECIKCFACSQECPVDANFFTLKAPFPTVSKSQYPVSLDRRAVLTTAAFSIAAAPTLRLAAGEPLASKKLVRPPMSRKERDFLASCIRCTECIKACPTGILKTAGLEHGIRAFWSPVMVASEGSCLQECNACSEACPTDAIMKYPLKKKYAFKSGTAVFETSRCISYTENKYCNECWKACPTTPKAIEIKKDWHPEGGLWADGADSPAPKGKVPTRPVEIDSAHCVGCGACETECNKIVLGQPAMILYAYGRTDPTDLDLSLQKNVVQTGAKEGANPSIIAIAKNYTNGKIKV